MNKAPVWYLHPDEPYGFMDVNDYVAQTTTPQGAPTTPLYLRGFHSPSDYLVLRYGKYNPAIRHTDGPVYVHTLEYGDKRYVYYSHFHGYNGFVQMRWTWLQCISRWFRCGTHSADIETVCFELDKGSNRLLRAYYFQHGDGEWIDADQLEYEDGHPVVYVALNSHASYPHAGQYARYKVLMDKCAQGKRLTPLTVGLNDWQKHYVGNLGQDTVQKTPSVRSWAGKYWFDRPPHEQ